MFFIRLKACYLIPILGLFVACFLTLTEAQEQAQPDGFVIRVTEKGDIYIDLGEKSGIRAGTKISVYKQGEEITHPITKQVLRGGDILMGEIEVKQVGLDYSIASVSTPDLRERIDVGDIVRLPVSVQAPTGGGREGRPFIAEKSNVDAEVVYVSYGVPGRAYLKDSIEFWYRFPSRTRNTMSIILGQDGYLTPKGQYFWYGLGAWVLDSFLFDVDLSLMFGGVWYNRDRRQFQDNRRQRGRHQSAARGQRDNQPRKHQQGATEHQSVKRPDSVLRSPL